LQGLVAININLDRFGLGLSLLGQANLEHTLIIVGAHLPRIDGTGQRERTCEASILPLDTAEVLLFFFLLDLPLALDSEGGVLNPHINVFFVVISLRPASLESALWEA
jgi:hypothetical protein